MKKRKQQEIIVIKDTDQRNKFCDTCSNEAHKCAKGCIGKIKPRE